MSVPKKNFLKKVLMVELLGMFDPYAMLSSEISHEFTSHVGEAPQVQHLRAVIARLSAWKTSPNLDERSHDHLQLNLNYRYDCIRFQKTNICTFFRANFISMCDGMIMTPAILAPMRPIFSRQARTGTRQHRNRIDHKFRYERPKKKKNGKTCG